jgi:LPXTG-site transpeptidase (sortase) family protein
LENIVEIDLDANNDGNFSGAGEVSVASVSSTWPAEDPGTSTMILPKTGFAPGISTLLPVQPSGNYYSSFSSLSIEIPKLSVHAEIFGVPNTVDSWDVTWLGQNVGWLSGSAFPTWSGNSVLTGHVWDEFNRPGIFNSIKQLSYGDQILIRAYGVNYTYEVRDNRLITAENIKSALKHEDTSWVTLLTCEGFTKETNSYPYRRIVRAVLVSID